MPESILHTTNEVVGALVVNSFAIALPRETQNDPKDMRTLALAIGPDNRCTGAEIYLRFIAGHTFHPAKRYRLIVSKAVDKSAYTVVAAIESMLVYAAHALRQLIEKTKSFHADERLRIIPVPQAQLWNEGVEAGSLVGKDQQEAVSADDTEEPETAETIPHVSAGDYVAGKWGRFLRAPDLYFRLIQDYGSRFVKLGKIADIKFGIKSGCDAFFMPRDVTHAILEQHAKGLPWNDIGLMKACKLSEVESGNVKIVRAGDNTLHPIESEYLRPEVHSLMQISRPVVRASDTDRVVLWVNVPLEDLGGTYVAKYIRWGAKRTFESKKSKAVPVPQRSTCASRPIWYDLTNATTGVAFWPMAQQYRHIIPSNPDGLLCNHNLFYLSGRALDEAGLAALPGVLNSTLIGLFKTYYGRYAGTEGNLKTEVIDVNLLDVPDPRRISRKILERLLASLSSMQKREVTHLVEEDLMDCHTAAHTAELSTRPILHSRELGQADRLQLDDAVLEILGLEDREERLQVLNELHFETAKHFRQIRVVEIQKQEQRAGGRARRFTAQDLAASIWDSLPPSDKSPSIAEWLTTLPGKVESCEIHDGKAKAHGPDHLFDPCGVAFTSGNVRSEVTYSSVEQATLVGILANLEIRGTVKLPQEPLVCKDWIEQFQDKLSIARSTFETIAASRTGTARLQEQTADLLMQWLIHGRPY